jgi:two-component system cell cycle response regulator
VTRILVIEDNPTNLELMTYLLSAHGYEVLTATDGEAGIEAARRERPDLIVCDVQLPRADGHEVVRQLQEQKEFRQIPLIAVTALAMVGDRERLLNAGFDGYIAKPIQPEKFVQQVASFLPADLRSGERTPRVWAEAAVQPSSEALFKGTVLVIDDTKANRDLLHSLLEPHGYTVVSASSLATAEEEIRRARPDLILADIHLADGNSLDFIRSLREQREYQSMPVLFQSASAQEVERREISGTGLHKLLRRPLEAAQLLFEIQMLLSAAGKMASTSATGGSIGDDSGSR